MDLYLLAQKFVCRVILCVKSAMDQEKTLVPMLVRLAGKLPKAPGVYQVVIEIEV